MQTQKSTNLKKKAQERLHPDSESRIAAQLISQRNYWDIIPEIKIYSMNWLSSKKTLMWQIILQDWEHFNHKSMTRRLNQNTVILKCGPVSHLCLLYIRLTIAATTLVLKGLRRSHHGKAVGSRKISSLAIAKRHFQMSKSKLPSQGSNKQTRS